MSQAINNASAAKGAAGWIAAAATLFVTPLWWSWLGDDLLAMLRQHYDYSVSQWLHYGLWGGGYIGTFYVLQLSIYAAVGSVLFVIALRFI